jgi:glycosyltransferase involved in cell wall biosynthesis
MSAVELSVVIPTHNRLDVLPEVLAALERQQDAPRFEVIVVDDGSTDGTAEWLDRQHLGFTFLVLHQANQGPAMARNTGVLAAHGRRVAFLGDDTVPAPGWLAAHRRAHAAAGDEPTRAVIGYTRWHRRLRLTPFLRYINEYGLQFGYSLIRTPEDVDFNFFYTSNLSLGRGLLLDEPFDLSFPYAAWEDIELAYRLKQGHRMRLTYAAAAVVEHDHPTDLRRFMTRQEKAGYSAVAFYQLHPELGSFLGLAADGPPPLPPSAPQRRRELLVRALQPFPLHLPRLWEDVLRFHYIRGLHRGWRERVLERGTNPGSRPSGAAAESGKGALR